MLFHIVSLVTKVSNLPRPHALLGNCPSSGGGILMTFDIDLVTVFSMVTKVTQ